jgi:hypothetical protein
VQSLVHPNIDLETGFVCLWTRHGTRETVVEALRRLQEVIAWTSFNRDTEHLMQRDAEAWRTRIEERHPDLFPLPYMPIEELLEFRLEKERFRLPTKPRQRLEQARREDLASAPTIWHGCAGRGWPLV